MKIKNIQILLANKALDALIQLNLPLGVKTNYKLAKMSLAIRSEASVLENTQKQILAKYSTPDVPFGPSDPNFDKFFREWKEIADMDVELAADKIKLEELDIKDAVISIEILRDLDPFIEQ
jgi:hypothetical protein